VDNLWACGQIPDRRLDGAASRRFGDGARQLIDSESQTWTGAGFREQMVDVNGIVIGLRSA
jgi:hypothetical protein